MGSSSAKHLRFSLQDNLFQLLFNYKDNLSERQIALYLGLTKEEEKEMITQALQLDQRFVFSGEEGWSCLPMEDFLEDRPLKETSFIITDLETTGSIRGKDRIIDIAALKVKNGQEVGRFESLVNPQKHISKTIARLTGIDDEQVEDAPLIEEVLPDYMEFVGDGIFVAHNSLFDFAFLNAELRRLDLPPFVNQVDICTFRIAKKLLPELKACGINGLSEHYGIPLSNRHRAMPDVEATKFFMDRFFEELQGMGITSLFELIRFQQDAISNRALYKRVKKTLRKGKNYRKPRHDPSVPAP